MASGWNPNYVELFWVPKGDNCETRKIIGRRQKKARQLDTGTLTGSKIMPLMGVKELIVFLFVCLSVVF